MPSFYCSKYVSGSLDLSILQLYIVLFLFLLSFSVLRSFCAKKKSQQYHNTYLCPQTKQSCLSLWLVYNRNQSGEWLGENLSPSRVPAQWQRLPFFDTSINLMDSAYLPPVREMDRALPSLCQLDHIGEAQRVFQEFISCTSQIRLLRWGGWEMSGEWGGGVGGGVRTSVYSSSVIRFYCKITMDIGVNAHWIFQCVDFLPQRTSLTMQEKVLLSLIDLRTVLMKLRCMSVA